MEELQCALLGLGSSSWATHAGVSVSPELKSLLHPTEYQLIVETLPLGSAARTLREYAAAVRAGRHDGYLASAVGLAISDVLDEYDVLVQAADSVAKLDALRSRLLESFLSLVRITHHAREPEVLALLVQNFVTKLDLDGMVRERLGTAVATSVLYVVAHFVAHGTVLEGRRNDFFIAAASTPAPSSSGNGTTPQAAPDDEAFGDAIPPQSSPLTFCVNKRLLPCGIPVDLAESIVAAGQERHLLKRQLQSRELTSHFDGQRDEDVCRTIHASVFNPSLVIGGHLSLEDLQLRVEAARQLWSRSLWMLVRQESRLSSTVQALYDHYLGHRGDLWGTFAALSFASLASLHQRSIAGRPGSELPISRAVEAMFRQALRACQLEDDQTNAPVFLKMDTVAPVAHCSLEEVPQVIFSRISLLLISVDVPVGVSLIIRSVHLERYRELFEFQMVHRYAMHALHDARRGVGELLKLAAAQSAHDTSAHPSTSLSTILSLRQFLSRVGVVLHFYTFVISTVNSYFQLDACESHYAQLVQTLEHRCHSVADARAAHEQFLFSVCDAVFAFDETNALQQTIRGAATSAFQLWALVKLLSSRSADSRLSSDTLGCLTQLERQQSDFTITITSLVATSTKPHERSLWIRLDFNRFLSHAWSRGSSAAGSGGGIGGGSRRGTQQVGAPISLAGLRVPQATVSVAKLASTPIPGSQVRPPEPSVRDF